MLSQQSNGERADRIDALRNRAIQLKHDSKDMLFNAYLDQLIAGVNYAEGNLQGMEKLLEQNYQLYLKKQAQINGAQPRSEAQPQPVVQSQSEVQPQPAAQPQPATRPQPAVQSQPAMRPQQNMPTMNRPVTQAAAAASGVGNQVVNHTGPANHDNRTLEFKFGTIVLGLVGILFLLIAFVTFGLQYMSSTLQGIIFYAIGIGLFAFSELYLSKRLEKFSYFLSGLGIAGLYITTMLNYLYLKIFPSYVAIFVTVVITGFFYWLSYKKDSGMIRIICLLGCYVSLVPLDEISGVVEFAIPATIIVALNIAGLLCPLKKINVVTDYMQYAFTFILSMCLIAKMDGIDSAMNLALYIFICINILVVSILCLRKSADIAYNVLYYLFNFVSLFYLLVSGHDMDWIIPMSVVLGVMYIAFMFVYKKTSLRFAPYIIYVVYVLIEVLDVAGSGNTGFYFTIACMIVFLINRMIAFLSDGFEIYDLVFAMLMYFYVLVGTRSDDLQMLGYVFAILLFVGAFIVKEYKRVHIYSALTFLWFFLMTEDIYPLVCSVLITVLAAGMITGGFMVKEKPVRIYGICILIFVALKLVFFDFSDAEAFVRIIVFSVVGVMILGISFLYIFLEKKQSEKVRQNNAMGINQN